MKHPAQTESSHYIYEVLYIVGLFCERRQYLSEEDVSKKHLGCKKYFKQNSVQNGAVRVTRKATYFINTFVSFYHLRIC